MKIQGFENNEDKLFDALQGKYMHIWSNGSLYTYIIYIHQYVHKSLIHMQGLYILLLYTTAYCGHVLIPTHVNMYTSVHTYIICTYIRTPTHMYSTPMYTCTYVPFGDMLVGHALTANSINTNRHVPCTRYKTVSCNWEAKGKSSTAGQSLSHRRLLFTL